MSSSNAVLQSVLADLIDLGLQTKQAHWNVQGPAFRSVHLQLDEVNAELLLWQDEVAERISALGGHPDGRAATVASLSSVSDMGAGAVADVTVMQAWADKLSAASSAFSAQFGALEDDLPSQDILIGIVAGLDKQAWFFRAQVA